MKIDKQISRKYGPNVASVFTVLFERAERATLEEDGRRYFFCPVGRCQGIEGNNYRPLIDQLPWLAEQTIRDSIRRATGAGIVQILPKADKRAFVRNAEGRRTQTRTHSYHVSYAVLDEVRNKRRSEFAFFRNDEAVTYGVNAALVLQELRYQLSKAQVKDPQTQIAQVSVDSLAKRLPISKSSIRRAIATLLQGEEIGKAKDGGYLISKGTSIKLDRTNRFGKRETLMESVEQEGQGQTDWLKSRNTFCADRCVPTGLKALDDKMRDLQKGQLGFLFGYTGHGKTAFMMQMALGAAKCGMKTLVISLEEKAEDLMNRVYANYFDLSYSKLHLNDAVELTKYNNALEALPEEEKLTIQGLKIVERRGERTSVCDLGLIVDGLAQEGFFPDLVYVDQFSYLKPVHEAAASWENEQTVAGELNGWAVSSLQGPNPFFLWVLAQAKGEPSKVFDRNCICGRKEIIQSASFAIGLGHTDADPRKMTVFSLKMRHGAGFGLTLECDLSRMRIGHEMAERGANDLVALSN